MIKELESGVFGSFDGAYGENFSTVPIPRVLKTDNYKELSLLDLANGLVEVLQVGRNHGIKSVVEF